MENKKAVKLTDFQKNEENPFMKQAIEGIENHVVKKYKSNSGGDKRAVVALADTETGEVFKTSFIRQIEVDEEQFTKLYLSNFAAFFDLSQAAIRVFGYSFSYISSSASSARPRPPPSRKRRKKLPPTPSASAC